MRNMSWEATKVGAEEKGEGGGPWPAAPPPPSAVLSAPFGRVSLRLGRNHCGLTGTQGQPGPLSAMSLWREMCSGKRKSKALAEETAWLLRTLRRGWEGRGPRQHWSWELCPPLPTPPPLPPAPHAGLQAVYPCCGHHPLGLMVTHRGRSELPLNSLSFTTSQRPAVRP